MLRLVRDSSTIPWVFEEHQLNEKWPSSRIWRLFECGTKIKLSPWQITSGSPEVVQISVSVPYPKSCPEEFSKLDRALIHRL